MKISEDNLVLHIQQRNETALRYVIEQYGGLVKSVVRRHLFNDAQNMFFEECVSDIFLGVWDNINSYDAQKNTFKNWIAAIARFKAIDYGRKYALIRRHESEEGMDAVLTDRTAVSGFEPAGDPYDQSGSSLSEPVAAFLAALSEEDRELFRRVYLAEDSIAEISQDTGMKRDVIYNRLSRGRKKLKQLYAVGERGNKL